MEKWKIIYNKYAVLTIYLLLVYCVMCNFYFTKLAEYVARFQRKNKFYSFRLLSWFLKTH